MPIFISRFSPERGLVGLLQSVNSGGRSKEQEATQKSPITRETRGAKARRETEGTRRKSSETKDAANTAAIQRPNRGETTLQAGGADNQRTVDGRDGLTAVGNSGLIFTLNARSEVKRPGRARKRRKTRDKQALHRLRFHRQRSRGMPSGMQRGKSARGSSGTLKFRPASMSNSP